MIGLGLLKAVFGSGLARIALVGIAAYLYGYYNGSGAQRDACRAAIEQSRAQAAQIDKNASEIARQRALQQAADAEARQFGMEQQLKELANVVQGECPLSDDIAERLNRLSGGEPGEAGSSTHGGRSPITRRPPPRPKP